MKYARKIFPFLALLVLIIFINSRVTEIFELKKAENTVSGIQNELYEKKKQNTLLHEQLKYYQSNQFIEQEAREKLNLTRKNEALVITTQFEKRTETQNRGDTEKENWQKWLDKLL